MQEFHVFKSVTENDVGSLCMEVEQGLLNYISKLS